MIKTEAMTQAQHAAQFLVQHLREAASAAGAVEGRALMPMIRRAAELATECATMLADMHEDGAEVVTPAMADPAPEVVAPGAPPVAGWPGCADSPPPLAPVKIMGYSTSQDTSGHPC